MISPQRLVQSIPCAAAAITLWLISVALMALESFTDWREPGLVARWSLLIGLLAVCATVAAIVNHARRVVLDVMSWEHKLIRSEANGRAPAHASSVIPFPRIKYGDVLERN